MNHIRYFQQNFLNKRNKTAKCIKGRDGGREEGREKRGKTRNKKGEGRRMEGTEEERGGKINREERRGRGNKGAGGGQGPYGDKPNASKHQRRHQPFSIGISLHKKENRNTSKIKPEEQEKENPILCHILSLSFSVAREF